MSYKPIVLPENGSIGVAARPKIAATFPVAMDEGTLDENSCVLIRKTNEFAENDIESIPVRINLKRLNLADEDENNAPDYGESSDTNRGKNYRSRVELEPQLPLKENSNYSVILGKKISALSVFDPKPALSNTGSKILSRGAFKGLADETYTIEITDDGGESRCLYNWRRHSDNYTEYALRGRRRFIEIDKGLFIKFPDGEYKAGDSFTVNCKPLDEQDETIAWDFSTSLITYETPENSGSNSSVNLPVVGGGASTVGGGGFSLSSISPEEAETMVKIGKKATGVAGGIVFQSKEKTDSFNGTVIKIIEGTPSVYVLNDEITFEIVSGTTTHEDLIQLLESSSLDIEASSVTLGALVSLETAGKMLSGGEIGGQIVLEFTKDIDPASIDDIEVHFEDLEGFTGGQMTISKQVNNNKLIITIED